MLAALPTPGHGAPKSSAMLCADPAVHDTVGHVAPAGLDSMTRATLGTVRAMTGARTLDHTPAQLTTAGNLTTRRRGRC